MSGLLAHGKASKQIFFVRPSFPGPICYEEVGQSPPGYASRCEMSVADVQAKSFKLRYAILPKLGGLLQENAVLP